MLFLFYHGERKWNYKQFEAHFGIDKELQVFLPKFEYRLIDLANYSDEFILSMKWSFLVNSLLAFKHKGDGDYVRQYFTKIFINLEDSSEIEPEQNSIHYLTVYISLSTKIKFTEMLEMVEKLPPKVGNKVKSTYEQLIEEGRLQGLEKGIEKGIEIEKRNTEIVSVQQTIDAIIDGFKAISVSKIIKIPLVIVVSIEKVYNSKKVTKTAKIDLAKNLMQYFVHLKLADIATFSKLKKEEIEVLMEDLNEENSENE